MLLCMIVFLSVKISVLTEFTPSTDTTRWTEFICFLSFVPMFGSLVKDYTNINKKGKQLADYAGNLNQTLIEQTHNSLFYSGQVSEGAKTLTKQVAESMCVDRCSIWLYNHDRSSIICDQLYITVEDKWYTGVKLFKNDFAPYFDHLLIDPIIIANDAETHSATSCFLEGYLKPLGVKSMLDVPVIHKGEVIGVICIESLTPREWVKAEVNFAQLLSSLYTFAYSVKESNDIYQEILELEDFVDKSVLVSRADNNGKITYVNKKFEQVSGYKSKEVIGKDHNIVNSGFHSKEFWADMYKTTVVDKKIWNAVVTNKNKKGHLYWVDSYIKAEFNEDGSLYGFMSIRYDVTDVIKSAQEIEKKNTYLEHAAKILRHDMHSGINTYIPRGISSLERRLKPEDIQKLKIEAPLRMIKEGLVHTQKVYKGVYEFTNLVKKDAILEKKEHNLKNILDTYLTSTSYKSQVLIKDLPIIEVNEALFCTAVDNLIRNGLKYNDSDTKIVTIFMENDSTLIIQDNGRGMTQEEFDHLSKPYTRKKGQKETGTGLGLNICVAILSEHGFKLSCEKNDIGTKMKIKIKND